MHGIGVLADLYKLDCLPLGIRSKYVWPVTVNMSYNILLWPSKQAPLLVVARGHKYSCEGRTALLAICKIFKVH